MAVPSKYIQSVVKAAKGRPKSTDWYRTRNEKRAELEEQLKDVGKNE